MRVPRLLAFVAALTALACEPVVEEDQTVELTLRLKLGQGYDIGATPGRVFIYADSVTVNRAIAFPYLAAEVCVLATTPVTTCTVTVPRLSTVSLVAAEPDGAVWVRFTPQVPQDTVRDGRYVEFTGWTECDDRAERGLCVVRPSSNVTIEANFQLMQQVTIYQTGAARMEYRLYTPGPTLKVPAENYNILDYAGCKRDLAANPWVVHDSPCDSVRVAGDSPHHRFTAYVPRKTIVGMFPIAGPETEYDSWVGDPCILSGIYWLGVCSFISPDTVVGPLILTARFTWWDCPGGPSERDQGGCVLRRP